MPEDGPALLGAAISAACVAKAPRRTIQSIAAAVTGVLWRPKSSSSQRLDPRRRAITTEVTVDMEVEDDERAEASTAVLLEARRASRRRKRAKKKERRKAAKAVPAHTSSQQTPQAAAVPAGESRVGTALGRTSKEVWTSGSEKKEYETCLLPAAVQGGVVAEEVARYEAQVVATVGGDPANSGSTRSRLYCADVKGARVRSGQLQGPEGRKETAGRHSTTDRQVKPKLQSSATEVSDESMVEADVSRRAEDVARRFIAISALEESADKERLLSELTEDLSKHFESM